MDKEAYVRLQSQTDELMRNTTMQELRGLKASNMLLFKVIGFMIATGVAYLTYLGKDVMSKLDAYALSNNTVEIHQTILAKDLQKLEQRVIQVEQLIITLKKDL